MILQELDSGDLSLGTRHSNAPNPRILLMAHIEALFTLERILPPRHMSNTTMLNEVDQLLGKIGTVVAGPFQCLRDQQERDPVFNAGTGAALEMYTKELRAQHIKLDIGAKNSSGAFVDRS